MVKLSGLSPHISSPLPPAPSQVVGGDGKPLIGTYVGSVDGVDLSTQTGEFRPRLLDPLIRNKAFTYTAVSGVSDRGEHVKVVMAVTDLGYASQGFVTVFDMDHKLVLADHSFLGPACATDISAQPLEGLQSSYHGPLDGAHLSLSHPREAEEYSQHIEVPRKGRQPAISFDGVFGAGGPPPATIIAPMIRTGDDHASATEMSVKSQALEGSGTLNVGEQSFHLDHLMASIDYSSGTMSRLTDWRWGSVTGKLDDGRKFGINMGEGFNDSDPRANNNLLWVEGKDGWSLLPLPAMKWDFEHDRPLQPWRVSQDDERWSIDMRFEPVGMHSEKTNLGIIKSDFAQPSGFWTGQIQDKDSGQVYKFKNVDGVAEDQNLKW